MTYALDHLGIRVVGRHGPRRVAARIGLVLIAVLVVQAGPGTRPSGASPARLSTLYSVATAEQYVNNADDRARGKGANPFGNFKDASSTSPHPGGAPFPGDEAMFQFTLYTNQKFTTVAGSALYTCQYNFDKNAYCDAVYQLPGGALFAAGAFNFNAGSFALAITGGTEHYAALTGTLHAAPGPRHSQRLAFSLS